MNPIYHTQQAKYIRFLFWCYIILLLFEGALRKWITPGLSNPLLIIRDPFAIAIYAISLQIGIFPRNKYANQLYMLAVACGLISLLTPAGLKITAFGLRTNFLHLPLMFILPKVFNFKDLIKIGKFLTIIAIPMAFIVAEQFQATPDDIINTTAGGAGRQLETSGGKVRASGTFTFVTGIVSYFSLILAFTIAAYFRKKTFPWWLMVLGLTSIFVAMVTSGSRSVVAGCFEVLAAFAFLAFYRFKEFGKIFGLIFISATILIVVSQSELFKDGIAVLNLRFEEAASAEMGPVEEFFERNKFILSSPIHYSMDAGLLGRGLGSGTNTAAALGYAFYGENEWARNVLESGFILGNLFILWRIQMVWVILRLAIFHLKKGHYFPIFLAGASITMVLYGQLGQPTTLGFATIGAGLCLTSMNTDKSRSGLTHYA
jgi:hypothetical protein